jgi:membrane-associated phospholipid phosphatase
LLKLTILCPLKLTSGLVAIYLSPSRFDLWFMEKVARLLGTHPFLDLTIQGAISHNILGGFWFAAVFFCFYVSLRPGQETTRQRLWTIILGSMVATALTFLAAATVGWLPPNQDPRLIHLYPGYIDKNANPSSFPSQSVALYSSIAAGIYSIRKLWGLILWLGVAVLVAIPRVYVGGHYPSDIVAGLACGLIGYWAAISSEPWFAHRFEKSLGLSRALRGLLSVAVFVWLFQVTTEFRDVNWGRQMAFLLTSPSLWSPSSRLCIGGDTVFGQYFNGRIDEVRIYNRALSPAEIQRDMNSPVSEADSAARKPSLVAAYSFDEGTGGQVIDSSGNSNNGRIRGATWNTQGKFGNALEFNGVTSLVTIRDSPTLQFAKAMTLEAWIYPTVISSSWKDIVYKEVDVYFLEATNSDHGVPAIGGKFADNPLSASSPLPVNTWTHLAGTFDGTTAHLYVDGQEVGR